MPVLTQTAHQTPLPIVTRLLLVYSENIRIFASLSQTPAISTYDIHETHFLVSSLGELGEVLYSAHSGVSDAEVDNFWKIVMAGKGSHM